MANEAGTTLIYNLQRRWKRELIWIRLLQSLSFAVFLSALLYVIAGISLLWAVPAFLVLFGLLMWLDPAWRVTAQEVIRFLNRKIPFLEESAHLFLKKKEGLNVLESMQVRKLEERLPNIEWPHPFHKTWRFTIIALKASVLLSIAMVWFLKLPAPERTNSPAIVSTPPAPPVAGIQSASLQIQPPAYTGKSERQQTSFDIDAEEGATIIWHVQTTPATAAPKLVFNDSTELLFRSTDSTATQWVASKTVRHPGFYQLAWAGQTSAFYRMEMIRDQSPKINIVSPKSYTVIDYGMPLKVPLFVSVSDDYGIRNATLVTTISSGSGEAVSFKEQETVLASNAAQARIEAGRTIDLGAMGLHPGDELYLYVKARDSHGQEGRSDVCIVSLPDTTGLLNLEGLVLPVDGKPEFFRSQRQIIIETEQLLREKDTLSVETFKTRSNNLGIDQKLLRLRYGKFLGEEGEENVLDPHETETEPVFKPSKLDDNAKKILDQFSDKHDNSEDASYFDADTKNQLKATLTEMWNSELRLRTFKPRDALPYEYKALRLLKDLQQKSRAYVAKTGARTTPLDAGKRLSGDLSKIEQPQHHLDNQKTTAPPAAAEAIAVLDQWAAGQPITDKDSRKLVAALQELAGKAAAEPGAYLDALQSLKRMIDGLAQGKAPAAADTRKAAEGLLRMTAIPEELPSGGSHLPSAYLSEAYFKNLYSPKP